MKNKIVILFLVVTTLFACKDPYEGTTYAINDLNPISGFLSANPDTYSEWIEILKYADLYNALNQSTQVFTAFVPDNEAVRKFYASKGISSAEGLDKEFAFELVRFHVIADSIPLEKFMEGGKLAKKTVSQDFLSISFDENSAEGGLHAMYVNKEARIKEHALPASNGYVYVLDGVLTPILESAYQKIEQNGQFGLFMEALNVTGWADSLGTIYDDVRQPNGRIEKRKRDYTVFAVSNAAFNASGIQNLNDLKDSLSLSNANVDYTNLENELNLYVAYHIMKGNYAIEDLTKFDPGSNRKMIGTLADAVMEISLDSFGTHWINERGGDTVRARLYTDDVRSDILAKNGIVHQLSNYAPIWQSEEPVEVLFDFTDYPEVAARVRDNTSNPEGQEYQRDGDAEKRNMLVSGSGESFVSCYNVQLSTSGLGAPITTYNPVDYFTCKTDNNNFSKARFFDQLILNIGYLGSIEMKTPIIIRGRYKVTLYYFYATSMNFMRSMTDGSNGGQVEFTFDGGNSKTDALYGGQHPDGKRYVENSTLDQYSFVLYDELEFDKTGAHTLKMIVKDPTASSHSSFRIQLDYMHFEPIP